MHPRNAVGWVRTRRTDVIRTRLISILMAAKMQRLEVVRGQSEFFSHFSSPAKHPSAKRLPLTAKQEVQRQLLAQQSPITAQAAKVNAFANLSFDMPFDLDLHSCPYEHHTHRFISLRSRSPSLGMKLVQCEERNVPKLLECLPG